MPDTPVSDKSRPGRREPRRREWLPYALLAPSVLLLLFFMISPVFSGAVLSLFKTALNGTTSFVGGANYRLLLSETRCRTNLTLSLLYVLGNLSLSLPFSYAAALLITKPFRAARALRGIYLLPWIVAPVVSALLFRSLVDPTFGPLSWVVEKVTGQQHVILTEPTLAMGTIILHSFWRSFPFMMLFLAAGIASIPPEVYEAARVDGGSRWTQFRYLTLPLTKVHLGVVLVVITMWTLQDAETVYAMTEGGPGYSTEVAAVRLFKMSFINFDLNGGATIGIVLVIVGVLFMLAYLRLTGGLREPQ
ncbi:MAG: sugar ABC transporter permease [bacterium]|nr:sugar ABC transporter permease [candidate division KSB1 bacterium]MDH7561387.1 sugar ABC transporter permease [bacterium]